MKDYSKYFSIPEEFVLSYDIKDNGMLIETTSETITTNNITKSRIKKYENILNFQYETLIKKQHQILKDKTDKIIIPFIVLSIVFTMICIFVSGISNLLGIITCALAVTTCITGTIVSEIYEKNFISKIKTYKTYLEEKKKMEKKLTDIPCLSDNFNEKTQRILQINSVLKERNVIEEVFNINFMDKASLKDLKKILKMYQEVQEQINFNQQEKTRKRTL